MHEVWIFLRLIQKNSAHLESVPVGIQIFRDRTITGKHVIIALFKD